MADTKFICLRINELRVQTIKIKDNDREEMGDV